MRTVARHVGSQEGTRCARSSLRLEPLEPRLLLSVADYLQTVQIEHLVEYYDPPDAPFYKAEVTVVTTEDVTAVEVTTAAANPYGVPLVETSGGTSRWELLAGYDEQSSLDAFGDGWYTLTLDTPGGQEQTQVWFGVPGTADPIPLPMQEPVVADPGASSPVTLQWQECTDTAAAAVELDLWELAGFTQILDEELPKATTSYGPLALATGDYEYEIRFAQAHEGTNADGVDWRVAKYSRWDDEFTIAASSTPDVLASIAVDHVWAYELPADPLVYLFEVAVTTALGVDSVDFETPGAGSFSIPKIDHQQTGDIETWWSFEGDHYTWHYVGTFDSAAALDDYGDGTYTFTANVMGEAVSTDVWFGVAGTPNFLAQPTEEPAIAAPAHGALVESPATLEWEPCTDANADFAGVVFEGESLGIFQQLGVDATSYGPQALDDGDWCGFVAFGTGYMGDNADGVDTTARKYSRAGHEFTVGDVGSVSEVLVTRGHEHGPPGSGENFYAYEVMVDGELLTGLQITTPWGAAFDAATYLPPGWAGEFVSEEDAVAGLEFEAGTDGDERFFEVFWSGLTSGQWADVGAEDGTLAVAFTGGTWDGSVDFTGLPVPAEAPNITAPTHLQTEVELAPTFGWDAWAAPGASAGIFRELWRDDTGQIVEETMGVDAATTSWTPAAPLDPGITYGLNVSFYHGGVVPVSGVDVQLASWSGSEVTFTAETAGDVTEVAVLRGEDFGYPGAGDDGYEYSVEVFGHKLTGLEVTTPWGAAFDAATYLPAEWAGEPVTDEDPGSGLVFEAGTDGGVQFLEVSWEDLAAEDWADAETTDADVAVAYTGGEWSASVGFSGVPAVGVAPAITSPTHLQTGVGLTPTIEWDVWATPGAGAGVGYDLEEATGGTVVHEADHESADTTSWTVASALEGGTDYEFGVNFHNGAQSTVAGVPVLVASWAESDVSFTTEQGSVSEVMVTRGQEHGPPGSGEALLAYEVMVSGELLTGLEVTTPWGEAFDAATYLPPGWAGEFVAEEDGALGLEFEAGTDGGGRFFEVIWEDLTSGQWADVEAEDGTLAVVFTGGTWDAQVGVGGVPLPDQPPSITSPTHDQTGVLLQPSMEWEVWASPGAGAGLWVEIENTATGDTVEEDGSLATDATDWTAADPLDAWTNYAFFLGFYQQTASEMGGVPVTAGSWRGAGIEFATGSGNIAPTIDVDDFGQGASAEVGDPFAISWTDDDPDSDAAISLFWDSDTDPLNNLPLGDGTDWGTIVTGISEDGAADTVNWFVDAPAGRDVYIRALIDDGEFTSTDYTGDTVRVTESVNGMAVVASHEYDDGVVVTFYDIDPDNGLDVPVVAWTKGDYVRGTTDVAVLAGSGQVVKSITLYNGAAGTNDLGILIDNNLSLKKLDDRRVGRPDLGFLVSEGDILTVKLKEGITGADINGLTSEGGWALPADLDNDGDLTDLTGLATLGSVKKLDVGGPVTGELAIGGDLLTFICRDALDTQVHVAGTVKKLDVFGDWSGLLAALWIGSARTRGELAAEIVVNGDNGKGLSISSLRAATASFASVIAANGVKTVKVEDWLGGTIDAAWLGSLTTLGSKTVIGVDGDFTGDVTLAGSPDAARSLAKAKFAGYVGNASWDITGDVGSITAAEADHWDLTVHSTVKSLNLGRAHLVVVDVAGPLGSLRVVDWDGGSLDAHSVKSIKATGNAREMVAGHFDPDVTLTGQGDPAVALASARIAGTLNGGTWDIDGDVKAIKAAACGPAWTLDAEGYLKSLYAAESLDGALSASTFGTVKTKGAFGANLTATGTDASGVALATLQAAQVATAAIDLGDGGIKTIKTGQWDGGSVAAAWLKALTVSSKTLTGDFAADLELSGVGAPGDALGKATISGTLDDATWHIAGDAGTVSIGHWGAGSVLAVGVAPGPDAAYFTGDDVATGGALASLSIGGHDTADGGTFGIVATILARVKLDGASIAPADLPLHDGDFAILRAADIVFEGVSLPLWNENVAVADLEVSLDNLAAIGVDWVAVNVIWFQEDVDATAIQPDFTKWSASDDSVRTVIQEVHERGMQVLLKPVVDLANDPTHWRGNIPGSEAWFTDPQGYGAFIAHFADIAQDEEAELLCVGTELIAATAQEARWRTLIADVRGRYDGALVYAANHGGAASATEADIGWWDALDFIGIDAYYPLTAKDDPTLVELQAAWADRAAMIETWHNGLDAADRKPILFTEVGYRSWDGANRDPATQAEKGDTNVDEQEQADCYSALFEELWGQKSWFRGAYWWNWEVDPTPTWEADNWYTPQGKPAEAVLALHYS